MNTPVMRLTAVAIGLASFVASAAPSDLDSTFGQGGVASVAAPGSQYSDVYQGSDGKLYVAAATSSAITVTRLTSAGAVDTTFGSSGVLTLKQTVSSPGIALAVDDTAKLIYVAETSSSLQIARFDFTGALDASYGSGGVYTLLSPSSANSSAITGLLVLPSGEMLVSGLEQPAPTASGGSDVLFTTLLKTNGTADTGYAGGNLASAKVAGAGSANGFQSKPAYDQSLGTVYMTGGFGSADGGAVVARWTSNGTLDTSFGANGVATSSFANAGSSSYPAFFALGLDTTGTAYGLADYTTASSDVSAIATLGSGTTAYSGAIFPYVRDGLQLQSDGKILGVLVGNLNASYGSGSCGTDTVCITRLAGSTLLENQTAPSSGVATGSVTVASDKGQVTRAETAATPSYAPTTYNYPVGFTAYTISGLTPGDTATITITSPAGTNPNAYVACENGNCQALSTATFSGDVTTVQISDGGPGDGDGVANGTITDPGAPAVIAATTGGTSGGTTGGTTSGGTTGGTTGGMTTGGSPTGGTTTGTVGPVNSGDSGGAISPFLLLPLLALSRRRKRG